MREIRRAEVEVRDEGMREPMPCPLLVPRADRENDERRGDDDADRLRDDHVVARQQQDHGAGDERDEDREQRNERRDRGGHRGAPATK